MNITGLVLKTESLKLYETRRQHLIHGRLLMDASPLLAYGGYLGGSIRGFFSQGYSQAAGWSEPSKLQSSGLPGIVSSVSGPEPPASLCSVSILPSQLLVFPTLLDRAEARAKASAGSSRCGDEG